MLNNKHFEKALNEMESNIAAGKNPPYRKGVDWDMSFHQRFDELEFTFSMSNLFKDNWRWSHWNAFKRQSEERKFFRTYSFHFAFLFWHFYGWFRVGQAYLPVQ